MKLKIGRVIALVISVSLMLWVGWSIVRDTLNDPANAFGFAGAFLVMLLPFIITRTNWGAKQLKTQPHFFWIVGGALLVTAVLVLGGGMIWALYNPSQSFAGTILGIVFVVLFGTGFMILATPTIFAIAALAKPSKEKK